MGWGLWWEGFLEKVKVFSFEWKVVGVLDGDRSDDGRDEHCKKSLQRCLRRKEEPWCIAVVKTMLQMTFYVS